MSDIVDFGFGVATRRLMDNGEIREKVVFTDGPSCCLTTPSGKDFDFLERWQKPHFHKGLTEVFVLVEGWAGFLFIDIDERAKYVFLSRPGETITFIPGVQHNMLQGTATVASAKILSTNFGVPIGNPHKNNNSDWWPASNSFEVKTTACRVRLKEVISRL